MMQLVLASLLALAQNDQAQANAYDNAWEQAWKDHCRNVLSGSTKTTGFVIHIGDSITYSNPYGQWIKNTSGGNKSVSDGAIITWFDGTGGWPGTLTPSNTNGIYLANVDAPSAQRSLTASSGISTAEYLSGNGNGGTAMPGNAATAGAAQTEVASATYTQNLNIYEVAMAFKAAQFAVVMLGTNDCTAGRTAAAFIADLQSIVLALEAQNIAVVLSTIPPHYADPTRAQQYNDEIRSYAFAHGLPLIDFYAEIIARRPSDWNGSLLGNNDVHPTASGGIYNTGSNPYASGTDGSTGDACLNVGYLLRAWLTVQKLKEVKDYVIDDLPVPVAPGGPGGGACGLTGLEALILLGLCRAARKSGF